MIDRQFEQAKKEEEQQRKELVHLFGGNVQLHMTIQGKVQGLEFRAFVKHQAKKLGLDGWICNTPTGVELVAEGPETDLNLLRIECAKGPVGAHVEQVQVVWKKATGEFSTFEIHQPLGNPLKCRE